MNAITTNNTTPSINNLDSDIQPYVERFHCFANKSAENVLQMCKVVSDAKAKLLDAQFIQFCLAIDLNKDASAISKMKKIGDRYNQLMPHKDKLPSAWTTLYRLADLSDDQFNAAVDNQRIHCNITAKDLNKIAPSKKSGKKASAPVVIDHADPVRDGSANSFTLKSLEILKGDKFAELKEKLEAIRQEFSLELIFA